MHIWQGFEFLNCVDNFIDNVNVLYEFEILLKFDFKALGTYSTLPNKKH